MAITLPTGWLNYFSGCQPAQGASCPINPFAGDPITAFPVDMIQTDPVQNPFSRRIWSEDNEQFTIQSRYNGFECCGFIAVPIPSLPDEFFAADPAGGSPVGTFKIEIGVSIVVDQVSNGQSGIFAARSTTIGDVNSFTAFGAEYDEQNALLGAPTVIAGFGYDHQSICDSANGQGISSCLGGALIEGNVIEIGYFMLSVPGQVPFVFSGTVEIRPTVSGNFNSSPFPPQQSCGVTQSEIRLNFGVAQSIPGFTENDLPNRAGIYTSGSTDGDPNRISYWRQFAAWKRKWIAI